MIVVIETMEVLVRQYELNSIDNNNSYTTRNRNRERNAGAKGKGKANEGGAMETESNKEEGEDSKAETNESEKMEAKGSVKREEPEEARENGEEDKPQQEEQQEQGPTLFVPSKNVMQSLSSMILSKGEHIGRGHTAYLTFATKL